MATFAAEMHMLIFDRALTTIVAYCIFSRTASIVHPMNQMVGQE